MLRGMSDGGAMMRAIWVAIRVTSSSTDVVRISGQRERVCEFADERIRWCWTKRRWRGWRWRSESDLIVDSLIAQTTETGEESLASASREFTNSSIESWRTWLSGVLSCEA